MIMINQKEYIERLNDLKRGPWTEHSIKAREYLVSQNNFEEIVRTKQLIVLPEKSVRDKELERVLRWHIYEEIELKEELEIRISLDYALEYLQLIELSIETGYIDLETVWTEARKEFTSLLWSKSSREYVKNYGLVAIECLAKRVNIGGFKEDILPPLIDNEAYFRFASFLSNHLIWHQDYYLNRWISFLDDYVNEYSEKLDFYFFILGDKIKRSDEFIELLIGIQNFVDCLFNIFNNLKITEYGKFGLFYSYWLAKFFGYIIKERNYINDIIREEKVYSWAYVVLRNQSIFFFNSDYSDEQVAYYKREFEKKIEVLEKVWAETRKIIDDSDLYSDLVDTY